MSRAHPDGPSTEPLTTFFAWPAARSAATARVRLALGTARRPERRRRRRTALGQRHVQLLEPPRHLRATRFPHITPRRTHRVRTHNNPGLGAARRGHAHARQVKRHALVGSAFTFPTGVASRPVGRLWTAPLCRYSQRSVRSSQHHEMSTLANHELKSTQLSKPISFFYQCVPW